MKKELKLKKIVSSILLSSMLVGVVPVKSFAGHPPIPQRKVIRLAGKDRFETAEKIAEKVIELGGNANEYALANGLNFPDALSGGAYCGKFKLPLLLTDGKSVPEKFKDKPVTIFGGEGVVNPDGINLKKRLAGKDRFETSYKIAEDGFPDAYKSAITTGYKFPDALSLTPFCAKKNMPLLLYDTINTNKSQYAKIFYDKTFNAVQGKYITSTYVAGMDNPPFQTNKYMSFWRFTSWGGAESKNRFETNRNIAYDIDENPKTVIVANGHKFADALAGSTLSSVLGNVPIVLTDSDRIHPRVETYLSNPSIETIYILGGENAVSKLVEVELSGKDIDDVTSKYMPKWSVAVHNAVYPITNVKANNQIDFSPIQDRVDLYIKEWVNSTAYFYEYKTHGNGKSMQLFAHATPYGQFVETAKFIYLCDINGVPKKYVKTHEITKVYSPDKKYADKDEWSIKKGTYKDCVALSTCTGEYQNGNLANPIYKIYVFEPVD